MSRPSTKPAPISSGWGSECQNKRNGCAQHVGRIQAAALLGVGAAFDFVAGTKPRAPLWMQRSGFEWLFRLMTEPRRLARRYLVYNCDFCRARAAADCRVEILRSGLVTSRGDCPRVVLVPYDFALE